MNEIDSIVRRNMPLVPMIIKRMGLQDRYDDFVDIGWIGLVRGCWKYNPESGFTESTWLCKCIYNEICNEIKTENRKKRKDYDKVRVYLDSYYMDSDDTLIMDTIPSDFDIDNEFNTRYILQAVEETIKYDVGRRAKKCNHKQIVRDMFGVGTERLNNKQIQEKYNISHTLVTQIKKRFRKNLRKRLQFIID